MNCDTARQTLELRDPDAVVTSAIRDAEAHVEDCADCKTTLRNQEQLDRRIARVCQDVPVPVGLKERLLHNLSIGKSATFTDSPSVDSNAQAILASTTLTKSESVTFAVGTRRRWFRTIVAATALVAVASLGGWWSMRTAIPKVALDEAITTAREAHPEEMSGFERFRTGDQLQLPATMLTSALTEPPQHLEKIDAAVYSFRIRGNGGRLVKGHLIVIPRAALVDPPTATRFLDSIALPTKLPYRTTAWVEGKLAFVCYVEGNEEALFKLRPVPA
jgi:hypothetical protein